MIVLTHICVYFSSMPVYTCIHSLLLLGLGLGICNDLSDQDRIGNGSCMNDMNKML